MKNDSGTLRINVYCIHSKKPSFALKKKAAIMRGIITDKNIILKYHFGTLDLSIHSAIKEMISKMVKIGTIIVVIKVAK